MALNCHYLRNPLKTDWCRFLCCCCNSSGLHFHLAVFTDFIKSIYPIASWGRWDKGVWSCEGCAKHRELFQVHRELFDYLWPQTAQVLADFWHASFEGCRLCLTLCSCIIWRLFLTAVVVFDSTYLSCVSNLAESDTFYCTARSYSPVLNLMTTSRYSIIIASSCWLICKCIPFRWDAAAFH